MNFHSAPAKRILQYPRWKTGFGGVVNVKAAFSYISCEQAEYTPSRELPDGFDTLFHRGARRRSRALAVAPVAYLCQVRPCPKSKPKRIRKNFYTSLYRCFMFRI